jgi:hypothetical protein
MSFTKQFPHESSEARPILQTLGVIYAIQWALRPCDTVIRECILPARPSPFSSRQIECHVYITRYLDNAMQVNLGTRYSVYDVAQANLRRCEPNLLAWCPNKKLHAAETDY